MSLQEKAANTIRKLLRLTQASLIAWKRYDNEKLVAGSDDVVVAAFVGDSGGTHFSVHEIGFMTSHDGDNFYRTSRAGVALLNNWLEPIWELPAQPAMWDLLEAVKIKAGEVEKALDAFLNEDFSSIDDDDEFQQIVNS